MVLKIGLTDHGSGSIGHDSGLVQSFSPESVRTRIRSVKPIIFFPCRRPLSVGSPPCAGKAPPLAVLNLQNPHPRTLETPPLVILLEKTLPLPPLGERILRKRKSYRERRGEEKGGERERGGACIVTRNNT